MAVTEQTPINSSTGNGVTTVFPYTFKIIADADLEVSVDGVVQVLNTDYTVSGAGNDAGGNVTFTTAPASLTTVVRRRNMAFTRATDYQYQGDLPNDVLNEDQDAPILMIQQLGEQVGRSVKVPVGDAIEALPPAGSRANAYLAFDADGNPIASSGTGADAGLRTDLASSGGAGLVTVLPAGVGGVAQTVAAWASKRPLPSDYATNADYVNAAKLLRSGELFAENGAIIHRLSDRLLIGDAIDCTGDSAATGASWLGGSPQPGLGWIEKNAVLAAYASKGSIGIAGAARTSQMVGGAAIGLSGIGYNDNAVNNVSAWGLYLEGKAAAGAVGATFAAEIEITTMGAYVDYYSASTDKTMGILLAAGADDAINGLTDSVTVGVNFTNNGANFGRGIMFGASALRGHADAEGLTHYKAMVLRSAMQIGWEDAAGASLGFIRSTVGASGSETSIRLTNNNVFLEGYAGADIAQFLHTAGAVNYALIVNNIAGSSPSYSVAGTDANIDIRLVPKGSGLVRFGTHTANADAPITGYISINDSGGTARKLAVIA